MIESIPETVVAAAMRPIVDVDVPLALRASIERQSLNLMGLATSLLDSGMDEQQVRTVIDRACASYRDELIATVLALRDNHEN